MEEFVISDDNFCSQICSDLPIKTPEFTVNLKNLQTRRPKFSSPVFSQLVTLGFPEIGQTVFVVPAIGSFSPPAVVVFGVSADVHHGVQRGRATPDTAPRPVQHPFVHVVLRQSVVVPIIPEIPRNIGDLVKEHRQEPSDNL